jgi:bifunctional UDP-N-acetylglucosamine pyrophosphorylase / glucosamine-1-phosphate N-acetyltransferase
MHQPIKEPFTALIMAAGQGTRMRSRVPKVLHEVCGKPMVGWVIDAAREAGASRIVCVVRPGDGVAEGLPAGVVVVEQREGEGTGAAVLAARALLRPGEPVVILSGDHPLVSRAVITGLVAAHRRDGATATLLTTSGLDPSGYGRVVRGDDGTVARIVETKHTDGLPAEVLAIREINVGTYAFDGGELAEALDAVGPQNGERYLTGAIEVLRERGRQIAAHATDDAAGAHGVNTRVDLMEVETMARETLIERLALAGVTFVAPGTVVIESGVEIGEDTVIEAGVTLRGATRIGTGARVGPHTKMIDARVGDEASVVHSHLVECEVRDRATIGPFAHLRPGTIVREGAKLGTFVEAKNSDIGRGTKVPHLSYFGDAEVGEESNIGAGNITANYDGAQKHRTVIGSRVKTGVDTSFVAPVSVGDGAYTGAGSVITEDVPERALGIARARQTNIEGYADRKEQEQRG